MNQQNETSRRQQREASAPIHRTRRREVEREKEREYLGKRLHFLASQARIWALNECPIITIAHASAIGRNRSLVTMSATAALSPQPPSVVRKSSMERLGAGGSGGRGSGGSGGGLKASATEGGGKAAGAGGASVLIGSKPTPISVPPLRFLIMDAPRQSNLHLYIKECRRYSVTDVVRVCEPTYLPGELNNAGMRLHEMAYADGHSPPQDVLDRWLALVDEVFISKTRGAGGVGGSGKGAASDGSDSTAASSSDGKAAAAAAVTNPTIAVHCVAGLGRAPVLVAIALVEFAGMDPVEAVTHIRKHRRGAINEKQLQYLEKYRKSYKRAGAEGGCCVIS